MVTKIKETQTEMPTGTATLGTTMAISQAI